VGNRQAAIAPDVPRPPRHDSSILEYAIYDDLLLTVSDKTATQVATTRLAPLGLHERSHLQEWILANPDVIGPGVKIVTSEFGDWQTASGDPVKDRLDILALDPDGGRLVVVELKIDAAPHSVHMQAINYAAMVSQFSKEDVASLYAQTHQKSDPGNTGPTTLEELSVDGLLTDEGIANPRIVLVAASFPASVTSAVVWLAKQGVEISLVRFSAYRVDDRTVVHFSRLFPVQDVDLIERAGVELAQAQALLAPIALSEIAKPLAAVVEAVAREIDGKRTGALATEFDDAHGGAKAGPQLRVLDLAVQAAALAS